MPRGHGRASARGAGSRRTRRRARRARPGGVRPRPVPTAEPERPEQEALPGQDLCVGVRHQAPAQHRRDGDKRHGRPPDVAVAAGRVVELGLGVVLPAQCHVGQHHPGPGGHRHPERVEEALERNEEVVGEEDDVDRAQHHDHAVDECGGPARDPQPEREQREAGRVDVEHCPADQPQHRDHRERHEEPGRQRGRERPDRVLGDRVGQLGRRPGEQQPEDEEHDRCDRGTNVVQPTTPRDEAVRGR